jgi:cytochrome c-type biogenesis protein CcmH
MTPVRAERTRRTRRAIGRGAVAVMLLALAAAGLWRAFGSSHHPQSLQARTYAVARGLRCPTCEGQSVADSQSDLARQMDGVIAAQLVAGRSPDQIHAWFAERYGDQVLLDPPAHGLGLLAQAVPIASVVLGLTAVLVQLRRWRRRGRRGPTPIPMVDELRPVDGA